MKKLTITFLLFLCCVSFLKSQKLLTVGSYKIQVPSETLGIKKFESGTIVEYYVEIKNDTLYHYELWADKVGGAFYRAEVKTCPLKFILIDDFDVEQIIGENYMYFRASIWTSTSGKPTLKITSQQYSADSKKVKKSKDMYIALYSDTKESLKTIESQIKK